MKFKYFTLVLFIFYAILMAYTFSNISESQYDTRFHKFIAIAGIDLTGCIGSGGKIPWNIPEDFEYYHNTTKGHVQIMGRKNYETSPPIFTEDGFYIILSTTMNRGVYQT